MSRRLVPSSSPYAPIIGFSRAVRVGNHISVAGTASLTRQCLEIIKAALHDWPAVAKVRGEYFRDIRPADTVVQVGRFIDKDWLVEIEVDAVVDED